MLGFGPSLAMAQSPKILYTEETRVGGRKSDKSAGPTQWLFITTNIKYSTSLEIFEK